MSKELKKQIANILFEIIDGVSSGDIITNTKYYYQLVEDTLIEETYLKCKECLKEQPKSNFYCGRSICKKCYKKQIKIYDKNNIENKRKRSREYERRKRLKYQNIIN